MRKRSIAGLVRPCSSVVFAILAVLVAPAWAQAQATVSHALLAIDQSSASGVERIVAEFGPILAKSSEYVSIDDLRTRLVSLRADRLLAASLARTEDGVREPTGFANSTSSKLATPTKALGDTSISASADSSFAAGHPAKETKTGSSIRADSQDFDFSNRNAKENFVPVDSMDVLAGVVAMPISTWNFKGADPSLRAIGPTAQDFYAAFHLGNDDKSIATSNLAGVALAAIQGLYQTMRRKDDQIAAQGQAIARLTGEVAAMRGELDRAMRTLARNGALR